MSVRVDVCESISRSHDGEIFSLPDLEINGMSRAQLCIREPQEAGGGGSWRNCTANLEIPVAGFTGAIVCPAEWQSICAANLLSFVGVTTVVA